MIREELHIYIHLLEDEQLYPIIKSNFLQSIDSSIPLIEFALKQPRYEDKKNVLIRLYNDLHKEYSQQKIAYYSIKEYVSLKDLWHEMSLFLFDIEPMKIASIHSKLLGNLSQQIQSQISWKNTPKEILALFNYEFNTRFIVNDEEKVILNHLESISNTHILNKYTLAILYLIVAESIDIPIFGLPFSDRIILCYAKEHCNHNEMVYEDDILFYFTPGIHGTIYTLSDLELYALSHGEVLNMVDKLPKSNQNIIQHWVHNLKNQSNDLFQHPFLHEKLSHFDKMFKIS